MIAFFAQEACSALLRSADFGARSLRPELGQVMRGIYRWRHGHNPATISARLVRLGLFRSASLLAVWAPEELPGMEMARQDAT